MEAEALAAIFDTAYEIIDDAQPFKWSIKLLPVDCDGDEEEEEAQNHVGIKLIATIPVEYPEDLPQLDVEIIKGLTDDHREKLLLMAIEESQNNEGMPAIFAICEHLREWLLDNNTKGLDDASMYASFIRKGKEEEQKKKLAEREFETQKKEDEMSRAEIEELTVRKRRAEGTPCIKENFDKWREEFEKEMAEKAAEEGAMKESAGKKSKEKKEDKSGRTTGFSQFTDKSGKRINLDDIEKAAAEAEDAPIDPEELDVDEELFELEDDDDLDDLDFDDDDDEPDI